VILGFTANDIVVISIPSAPPFSSGLIYLNWVTYGLPTHATKPVLVAEVKIAIEANASRAVGGKFDSITNMNGASVVDNIRDESEKILSLRNVVPRGPT